MIQILSPIEHLLFPLLFLICIVMFTHVFRQMYHKTSIANERLSSNRLINILLIILVGSIFTLGYFITIRHVRDEEQKIKAEAKLTVSALKSAIESKISKIDAGVTAINGSPCFLDYLRNRSDEDLINTNAVLDRYQKAFNAYAVYLMDTAGTTIASSNRNSELSFVGKNYSFRAYFQKSKAGNQCSYFTTGVTTGKRGYFCSAPIKSKDNQILGVIAFKYDTEQLDSIFMLNPRAFLVDQNSMIFLSGSSDFNGKPLFPLTELQKQEITSKVHYKFNSLEPLIKEPPKTDHVLMGKHLFLASKAILYLPDWSIFVFSPKESVFKYYLLGFSFTVALILIIFSLINYLTSNRIREWAEDIFLSEKRFQAIFEHAPEAITICECESGLVISANTLANRLLKINDKPVSILEKICQSNQEHSNIVLPLSADAFKGLFKSNFDGNTRHLSVSSVNISFKGKNCLVLFLKDISDIIKTQCALEESEQRYRELTDFLPEAIFEIDLKGDISYANKKAYDLFGYGKDDLAQFVNPLYFIIPKEHELVKVNLNRILNSSVQVHSEYTAVHKSGRQFPVMVHSTPIIRNNKIAGLCGVCIDLTERVRFEKEMFKKDKLEALGILAGGIAHDFNNLLTAIWAGVSIIKLTTHDDSEQKSIIQDVENALQRGRDLTGQLLTYSKGGAPIKEATSLELLAKETAAFTASGTQVKCEITSQQDLYSADIDSSQISQVIQNLLINAIEAMPQGGVIKISMINTDNPIVENVELPAGKYIELTVSDCGSGIPTSIQHRIYDPFFTTKQKGSGLGLATSYSIVKKHNGHIYFDTVLNKGTSFHVLLPASSKAVVQNDKCDFIPVINSGKILLMDDETVILSVTKELLCHLGYTVEIATDGETAINLYKDALLNKQKFDALILDLTIPAGMGGKETLLKLLEIDPEVKALVSSGYSNDPIMADYKNYGFKGVITKPYNIKELSISLQQVLNPGIS